MTQTPAGWYADPHDATQYRYWDGSAWTEHRSPRGPQAGAQLEQAANDLADGLSRGFSAMGTWLNQNVGSRSGGGAPTFASVAAACRDEPAREPLSVTAELVVGPGEAAAVAQLGALADQPCRLVPNPWDPAVPNGVAVFVQTTMVGRLPAELEAAYCGPLAQLASGGVVATAVVAEAQGAQVTVRLPPVEAFA